jgi:hypothetical protein
MSIPRDSPSHAFDSNEAGARQRKMSVPIICTPNVHDAYAVKKCLPRGRLDKRVKNAMELPESRSSASEVKLAIRKVRSP